MSHIKLHKERFCTTENTAAARGLLVRFGVLCAGPPWNSSLGSTIPQPRTSGGSCRNCGGTHIWCAQSSTESRLWPHRRCCGHEAPQHPAGPLSALIPFSAFGGRSWQNTLDPVAVLLCMVHSSHLGREATAATAADTHADLESPCACPARHHSFSAVILLQLLQRPSTVWHQNSTLPASRNTGSTSMQPSPHSFTSHISID